MGFVYNPEVLAANKKEFAAAIEGLEDDELVSAYEEFVATWELPWNAYYKNLGTIKDSIRDTYALAVGYVYRECLTTLNELYTAGDLGTDEYRETRRRRYRNRDSGD